MALPKEQGGYNLPSFKEIFSLSKTSYMVKYFSPLHSQDMWRAPLFEGACVVHKTRIKDFVFPLFSSTPFHTNSKKPVLKWFSEASQTFGLIPKTTSFTSVNKKYGCLIQDSKVLYRNDKKTHDNSIPVETLSNRVYKKCTNKYVWEDVQIKFFGINLNEKISLKSVRNTIKTTIILTKIQQNWITEDGIPLENLFSVVPKTFNKVKDFQMKCLRQFFHTKDGCCELCGKKFDSLHLFKDCPFIELIERRIDPRVGLYKRRKRCSFQLTSKYFTWAWLYNWSIWKLRNNIVHSEDVKILIADRSDVPNNVDQIDQMLNSVRQSTAMKELVNKCVSQLCHLRKSIEQEHLIYKKYCKLKLSKIETKFFRYFKVTSDSDFVKI